MERSSADTGVEYGGISTPWQDALSLFGFAGAWAPAAASLARGWGAWDGDRLTGALLAERAGSCAMLHGPVVVAGAEAPAETAIAVAGRLVADALEQLPADGVDTVFTRPQGLDRIWVRSGFIPIPEVELPRGLRGRPGVGLFGWRGGTALWSSAGRGSARPRSATR